MNNCLMNVSYLRILENNAAKKLVMLLIEENMQQQQNIHQKDLSIYIYIYIFHVAFYRD